MCPPPQKTTNDNDLVSDFQISSNQCQHASNHHFRIKKKFLPRTIPQRGGDTPLHPLSAPLPADPAMPVSDYTKRSTKD